MTRNPNWTRDEIILALELYFRVNPASTSETNPEIIALSALLNELPIHDRDKVGTNFRNPSGVYMKMCNFLRLDPNYEGKGLDAGSKLDEVVWDEFAVNRELLEKAARAIRVNYRHLPTSEPLDNATPSFDGEFKEGKILTRIHKVKERNQTLVRRKKNAVLKKTRTLACEVCGFDFEKYYGALGHGFAECHHLTPISDLEFERTVRLADLAIVCANCHRMLHRSQSMMSIEELTEIVVERNSDAL